MVMGRKETVERRTNETSDDDLHLHFLLLLSPCPFLAMSRLVAHWKPLAHSAASVALSPALIRSSHSLAIIGNNAYVFGGELLPRTPVSAGLTILSLQGEPPNLPASLWGPWLKWRVFFQMDLNVSSHPQRRVPGRHRG